MVQDVSSVKIAAVDWLRTWLWYLLSCIMKESELPALRTLMSHMGASISHVKVSKLLHASYTRQDLFQLVGKIIWSPYVYHKSTSLTIMSFILEIQTICRNLVCLIECQTFKKGSPLSLLCAVKTSLDLFMTINFLLLLHPLILYFDYRKPTECPI